MSRLYYLFTVIFLVNLCTISVMAGWSCGWKDGELGEWTPGQSAYVLEYANGSFIKCSMDYVQGRPVYNNTPCIKGKCHKLYYWDGNNWHDKGIEGYGCCKWEKVIA
ncbi:hypothetical protein Ddc_19889 [Ditylenchus destructor]|nr:hypothetical protein Ddc_19889 [Ditylenchus destructor]